MPVAPWATAEDGGHRVDLEETALPGIGLRHDFMTRSGRRVGVVSRRDGQRELVLYRVEDPDAVSRTLVLTVEEADVLAELLGAPRIVERLARLSDQAQGILSEDVVVPHRSPYDGRTVGDTRARTRTGASIVAVTRAGEVFLSPPPEFRLVGGDSVVVVGTSDGVAGVRGILTRDDPGPARRDGTG